MDAALAKDIQRLEIYRDAYAHGQPKVSDAVYDALEDKVRKLVPEHPFFKGVSGEKTSQFVQATTGEPMLSLDKIKDPTELMKFIGPRPITIRSKIDGGSLELRYQNSILVEAVSRGRDGELGFVCTANAMYLLDVPHELPDDFTGEIRGEANMTWEDFKAYQASGAEDAKHPRNVATGTMRQLIPSIVAERKIRFIAYKIMGQVDRFPTEQAVDSYLLKAGFKIAETIHYNLPELFTAQIEAQLNKWKATIENAPYPCDGVVITYSDRALQEQVGNSTNAPKWAKAFKWQSEIGETHVLDIEWETNRTGKVAPTAITEPVELSGATCSRYTLHNVGYVREHNIRIGALIAVTRSGEIIPTHLETIEAGDGLLKIPTHCSSCNGALKEVTSESEKRTLWCFNTNCSAQIFDKILNYVKVASIDHLGEGILTTLWDAKIVRSITDLYLIAGRNISTLITSKGKTLGSSTAKKIYQSIERASVLDPATFIQALGMPDVGKGTSERLIERFKTVEAVLAASKEELATCREFGPITTENVYNGLQSHKQLIENLQKLVKFKQKPDEIVLYNILNGARFVITGTLSNAREEVEKLIKGAGGEIQAGVSRNTNYLIVGEEAGASKLSKARSLGIKMITEDDLMNLLSSKSHADAKESEAVTKKVKEEADDTDEEVDED